MVFFLSIFATNMTAFAILGSSGQAYRQGIGIYGLMASSSGFVIPLTIFFIGTRLWALGKRFGHQTQVAFFRDRWECSAIGTVIFALSVAMLVPYMIISIMGGGRVLADISGGRVAYRAGLRGGGAGRHRQRLLRRHAGHGLGEHFPDDAVPVVRRGGRGGHQPRAARAALGITFRRSPANPKTRFLVTRERMPRALFLELYADPALLDHVSAHGHHVLRGAPGHRFQADGGALSAGDPGDLAAVRLPGRPGHAARTGPEEPRRRCCCTC